MMDMNRIPLSAVIVNFNAGQRIVDCVDSIISEVDEVIVVDNGSTDGSLDALERIYSGQAELRIIRNNDNLGFARACNRGLAMSTAHSVLFLNPDCVVQNGSLRALYECLHSNAANGLVGGMLLNADGSEQAGGRRAVPTPWRTLTRSLGLTHFAGRYPRVFSDFLLHKQPVPQKPIEVEAISGACMLVHREALADVGLLDEEYFMHCEDLDWCMRFRQRGWSIRFVPDARITHFKGTCSSSRPIRVEWHKHRGMVRFYRKFFRHQYPGVLMAVVAVGVWLRFSVIAGRLSVWQLVQTLGWRRG